MSQGGPPPSQNTPPSNEPPPSKPQTQPQGGNPPQNTTTTSTSTSADVMTSPMTLNDFMTSTGSMFTDYWTSDTTTSGFLGCEFGDRTTCPQDKPWRCYENTFRYNCCFTCDSFMTGVQGCEYGDKVDNCESHKCYNYSNSRRMDCCETCNNIMSPTVSLTTSSSQPMTSSRSSDTPAWIAPVAGCVGGILLILLLIFVFLWWRRRKQEPQNLSPIDEKMYNDYKLSKRAPMALPRDQESANGKSLTRQDSVEYAYINPDDVVSTPEEDNKRRSGNDPLPAPPSGPTEYLELGNPDKYGYLEPLGTIVKNGSAPPSTDGNQYAVQYNSLDRDRVDSSSQYRSLSSDDGSIKYITKPQTSPPRLNTYHKFPGDNSHVTPSNENNQAFSVKM